MTRKQRMTLLATIVGSGIVILDSSVVSLALPKIATDLNASFADLQWIVNGYVLSLSALILLGGSLGDIFGRKKVYLIGLVSFGFISLLCGLAPTVGALIGLRILQGAAGALLVPGGLAIINTNFPPGRRAAAIGTWSAASAIFAALGPLVGGYILDAASWRWIFFINVPLVVLCYFIGRSSIKEGKDSAPRRVDGMGAGLAALALAALTFGLIEGPARHWQASSIIALLLGVIFAVLFILHEKRTKDPMVRLSLFRSRNFTGSNLMTFGMYGALSSFFFALVIYLQQTMHYSSIKAGLTLMPVTILLFLFSRRVGALSAKHGARLFMTIGPLIAAAGIFSLIGLGPGSSLVAVLAGVTIFGAGLTLLVAPLTTTVMNSVSDSSSGIASGINNAVSRAAGLITVALLGLFGTDQVFEFAIILSGTLAALAGIISFFWIDDPQTRQHVMDGA